MIADKRIMRRLQNDLDRMADIDATVNDLVKYSGIGRQLRRLTDEFNELKADCKMYEIPVGTRLSSSDGSMTLGRMPGQRKLNEERYFSSGIPDFMMSEHPDHLIPKSAEDLSTILGCNINGYYTAKPFTAVTDDLSFRQMMDVIASVRD